MSKEALGHPHHAKWTYDNLSANGPINSEDLLGLFYEKSDRDVEEKMCICDLLRNCRSQILSLLREGGIISKGKTPLIYTAEKIPYLQDPLNECLQNDLAELKILSLKKKEFLRDYGIDSLPEIDQIGSENHIFVIVQDLLKQLRYQITKGGAVNVILDPYHSEVHVLLECFERFIKSVYEQNNVEGDRISPKTFIAACIAENTYLLPQQKKPEEFIER